MPARSPRACWSTRMFWTIVAYFIWHSLHARVEANWFAPVYPALAICSRRRRPPHAVGQWRAAPRRFLPALGVADGHCAVRVPDRAGQHRRAHGLSPRRHRAQRRRRLARTGRRDRSGAPAHRCHLRAGAGLRHHRLARLLSAEGHLRGAADPAHPLGQHARARLRRSCPASCCSSTRRGPARGPIRRKILPGSKGSPNSRASAGRWSSKPMGSICCRAPRAACSTARRRRNCSRAGGVDRDSASTHSVVTPRKRGTQYASGVSRSNGTSRRTGSPGQAGR